MNKEANKQASRRANKQTSKRADKEICFAVFYKYVKQLVKSPCLLVCLFARLLVDVCND